MCCTHVSTYMRISLHICVLVYIFDQGLDDAMHVHPFAHLTCVCVYVCVREREREKERERERGRERVCVCVRNVCISHCDTGWRRLIGSPKLQIIFHKRATTYRSLLQKMTYKDKGSYESLPPCTYMRIGIHIHTYLIYHLYHITMRTARKSNSHSHAHTSSKRRDTLTTATSALHRRKKNPIHASKKSLHAQKSPIHALYMRKCIYIYIYIYKYI